MSFDSVVLLELSSEGKMEVTIKRSSDGVPRFSGEPELLPMYREEALQYMMTLEMTQRYLAGPRLAKELTGVARMAIRTRTTQDPQWLAHPRGTYTLLEYLESFLAKPTLVEASRFIMKFFYNMRRRKGETMTAWIARHAEASQALRKVQKEYGSREMPPRSWTGRSPCSHSGPAYSSSRGGSRPTDTGRDDATENEEVLEEEEASRS